MCSELWRNVAGLVFPDISKKLCVFLNNRENFSQHNYF